MEQVFELKEKNDLYFVIGPDNFFSSLKSTTLQNEKQI